MKKYVYRITVNVTHMKGSSLPGDCAGAFVNVYQPADTIREAIDLAEKSLLADLYKPVETTAAYQLDDDEYESEYQEEGDPTGEDITGLLDSGESWYSAFHTYIIDE